MPSPFPDWPFTPPSGALWSGRSVARDFGPLPADTQADVVIVGAGFSGLWTAKHLTDIDDRLSVVVLDAMQPGYGASGRNGGWCSALMPMSLGTVAGHSGTMGATALQQSLVAAVGSIGAYVSDEGIDCDWIRGGTLSIATNSAQMARIGRMTTEYRAFGFGEEFIRALDDNEVESRVRTGRALGGWYSPHCAALDPARLVDGLVATLVRRGVRIHGRTLVRTLGTRTLTASTPNGDVRASARWVVLATEGFTSSIPGFRRTLAPIHSYMVATEPLPGEVWDSIGWHGRETFADGRHIVIYAQRTGDDRIAFGGRGAPYSFGGRIGPRHDAHRRIHDRIIATLRRIFPAAADAAITHRWGGALGAPRDWHPSVRVDRVRGLVAMGGYVGDGVAFSHVAARAAAHSILGTDDPCSRLPIVDHASPRWEPEPLRWMGINAMLRLGSLVDALESRESRLARPGEQLLDRVLG